MIVALGGSGLEGVKTTAEEVAVFVTAMVPPSRNWPAGMVAKTAKESLPVPVVTDCGFTGRLIFTVMVELSGTLLVDPTGEVVMTDGLLVTGVPEADVVNVLLNVV